jgi:hypothetical protein
MKLISATFLFTITFINLFHFAVAQKNIVPAYIVTNNSDTIRGYINDKNWDKSPHSLQFKQTMNGDFQEYSVSQLQSFYTETGEYYERHIVPVDKSPTEVHKLAQSPGKFIIIDTLLLSVYVKGAASLYYFKDTDNKKHYYIQKNNAPLEELIIRYSLKENNDGQKSLAIDKMYRRQLQVYLSNSDCPTLNGRFEKVEYNRKSLQSLLTDYNKCNPSSTFKFVTSQKKSKIKIGLIAGASTTNLDFKGDAAPHLVTPTFSKATGYTAGLSFDFFLPRSREKWSINNEVRWKAYSTKTYYKEVYSQSRYSESDLSFDLGYLSLVNMIRYRLPFKGIRPFINVGISNAFALKEGNNRFTKVYYYTTYTNENGKAIEDFRKYEQGLIGGLGIEWHRISGELRYETCNGMSEYGNLKSITRTLNFLLTFRLN